ncbi:MAG: dTDP-4-dehydrorhamnose reductase [Bacteroidia bacterium]|nr:dTDP-4-dehydrorhamnose reductase [Bacteroidia bacterium]
MIKQVLVSGSEGQLGKALQSLSKEYTQYSFDFFDRQKLDLASESSIQSILEKPYDFFINTAAYTAVDKAESEIDKCYMVNTDALRLITKHAHPKTKIIHFSTDYVYHNDERVPMNETMPTFPKSVYGKSKLAGEEILIKERPDSIVVRTSWVYSENGHNFVKTMLRLGKKLDHLKIVSDQLGAPTYAMDLADIALKLTDNYKAGIYNYANGGQTNWADFAREIFRQSGITCEVSNISTEEFGAAAPRPQWSVMSMEKISQWLETDIPDWKNSLRKCLSRMD